MTILRKIPSRLRRVLVFSRDSVRAWRQFLKGRSDPYYRFSPQDCWLYIQERHWNPPPVTLLEDAPVQLLEVDGKRIYWPRAFDSSGIGWLYCETMLSFDHNPSSYLHPAVALGSASWVIDLGACEGFFSLLAAAQGAKRVLVVEPVKALAESLRKTIDLQPSHQPFTLIQKAVSAEAGELQLNVSAAEVWNSNLATGGETVAVTTLDTIADDYALGENGVVKMDIEGAEMDALNGAKTLLSRYKPRLAIAVYHGYDNARLCRDIILSANPTYQVEFRGMYGWAAPEPLRPHLLFAW